MNVTYYSYSRSLLFFIRKITLFLFIPPVLETPCIVEKRRKAEIEREREKKKWKKKKKKERKVEEREKKLDASHGWVDRFVWSLI